MSCTLSCFKLIKTTMDSYGATTRIITILNHIAALRNFIDPRKNLFKFVCSWTWNIFLILMIAVVQFHAELNFLQRNYAFNIERITYIFQYVTHAFGYTSIIIIGLYQSKNALTLMKQIDRVDENLKNLGIDIDYRCLFRHVKIVGSFWLLNAIIILGIFITRMVRTIPPSCSSILTYIYITNAQSIVLYDYNTAISWLGSRFKMINQLLKTLPLEDDKTNANESNEEIVFKPNSNFQNRLKIDSCSSRHSLADSQIPFINDTSKFEKESPTVEKLRLLQQIRSLHLQVYNVSKLVNHMFNVQILIYTFTTLIYLSVSIYWIYMEIQRKTNVVENLDLVLIYLLDGVVGTLKIAIMSYDCEYAMRQTDEIITLIHACPLYRESTALKNETLQFLWQISYTQLEDTNSVRYILNYSFVRDCLYSVLTYLVIMIQLSQNFKTNDQITITNGTIF